MMKCHGISYLLQQKIIKQESVKYSKWFNLLDNVQGSGGAFLKSRERSGGFWMAHWLLCEVSRSKANV